MNKALICKQAIANGPGYHVHTCQGDRPQELSLSQLQGVLGKGGYSLNEYKRVWNDIRESLSTSEAVNWLGVISSAFGTQDAFTLSDLNNKIYPNRIGSYLFLDLDFQLDCYESQLAPSLTELICDFDHQYQDLDCPKFGVLVFVSARQVDVWLECRQSVRL
ncbi:MAG: hypothetical protein R6U67_13395 [Sodalinema sp.]|uniref:hypothetical protein n=1 Tax=Sodalinema sp. TaxID=3080550 RepID=UPI00396F4517